MCLNVVASENHALVYKRVNFQNYLKQQKEVKYDSVSLIIYLSCKLSIWK